VVGGLRLLCVAHLSYDNRTVEKEYPSRKEIMYLSELDIIAISIALVSLMALVVTSAVANARITRQRDEWRNLALTYEREQHD